MLSDRDIALELATGRLGITPLAPGAIQPASVDLHLGDTFAVLARGQKIDPRQGPPTMGEITMDPGRGFMLIPGGFALGATMETVTLPDDLSARYENKSSLARIGLATHFAGFVDPGFSGMITVELVNLAGEAIVLWPGMAVGQLSLTRLSSPAARPYGPARGSHYQGQTGPTPSAVAEQLAERGHRGRAGG